MSPSSNLYGSLQSLFASHSTTHDATSAPAGIDNVELELTEQQLPVGPVKDLVSRTLACAAGAVSGDDLKSIVQENYARYAIYESNLLWCPHSTAISAWLGSSSLLLQPQVEGIIVHRVVMRRVAQPPAATPSGVPPPLPAVGAAVASGPRPTPEVLVQIQFEVAFTWRPLAPLHTLLASWGAKGMQLPAFTTDHTITITVNQQGRVTSHQDLLHNMPSAPPLLKAVLGLPTPLLAAVMRV